jgi:enamine deaminase RidA (YjgF/YER057c/UK114 family)
MLRYFDPPGLAPGATYSHGAIVPGGMRLATIAGQVGNRPDGSVVEGFEAQVEQAFGNLFAALADIGMAREDLVRINVYMTDRADVAAYERVFARRMGPVKPPDTLLIVAGLARAEYRFEIDAWAAKAD